MFGRGDHALGLHGVDHPAGVGGHQRFVRTVGLIGTTPAKIPGDSHRGSEDPVYAGCLNLPGRSGADGRDQFGIPGRTQSNIVGENGGANYIVVAVDRIGAPNDRNTCVTATGIDGGPIVVIGHPQPVVDRRVFIAIWKRTTAVEDAAQAVPPHILWRDLRNLTLDHLTHFLLQGHGFQQIGGGCLGTSALVRTRAGSRLWIRAAGECQPHNRSRGKACGTNYVHHYCYNQIRCNRVSAPKPLYPHSSLFPRSHPA